MNILNILFAVLALAYSLEGINCVLDKKWKLAMGEFTLVGLLLFLLIT